MHFTAALMLTTLYTVGLFNLQQCIIFHKMIIGLKCCCPVFSFVTMRFPANLKITVKVELVEFS